MVPLSVGSKGWRTRSISAGESSAQDAADRSSLDRRDLAGKAVIDQDHLADLQVWRFRLLI